ncbi:MAG: MarR family transcriptional regulator [Oceanospirillaceae bacterium]|uniref:MarR family winged helix-turn-helix transcriptional regulator n=1 Tax=unclassified Thalassolituus TaxID=2624967 RepID=UPI000C4EE91D|nr:MULTISPECIES: MarR family transcriptional regulator [unclassified Thalassolituus]MAS25687.1 MarR family transcriptional regulator [Oceanospirillaceae bacterium]MAX98671.1 MarR family transcriptional regulator [Oceanospirillaceae bacterium]MBL35125.1 MarR family transcriptional regulator [Oceanospirillaceae bacterium]MBS52344.1 MarR family transcriptional regulator [Oceanospirillaceae bacterium]|tara:strand:- start:1661 stop:2158 length:498 start_codon:yes stop_codon:yes gene_type:complete
MSYFSAVESQLDDFAAKYPEFSRREAGLIRLIRAVDRQITDHANNNLRQFGLTLTEYNVLTMLDARGSGMSISELVKRTGEKPSNTTRLTDLLVKKNLLVREVSDKDRRVWLVKISKDGKALMKKMLPVINEQLSQLFQGFDDAQYQALYSNLHSLLNTSDRDSL